MQQTVRPLVGNDIERLIAIDCLHTRHVRRRFFEKRLSAAGDRPGDFVPIGIMRGGALRGFAIARILRGEFGRGSGVAVLDAIGVDPESQESGVGQTLMQELARELRRRGVSTLQSQAEWTNHPMLRFFETSGFSLSPRLVLERETAAALDEATEDV